MTLTRQDQDALERHAGYPPDSAAVRLALARLTPGSGRMEYLGVLLIDLAAAEAAAKKADRLFNDMRKTLCWALDVPVGPNIRERSAPDHAISSGVRK
jgi:nitrate reductase beta subunit